ncbi:hypothetical protein NPX13_g3743 [Xylaria arbuscula]|uniref:Uncharacterized protein n=1 Tax=Xylaria arbuscula TaxID=114810 RepID=A0A9W8NHB4_9PEZI|nr:hypothetical protein NPX13_g3743 [Xylaria arbuscula]
MPSFDEFAGSNPTTPGRPQPGRAPTSATRESKPGPPPPPRTAYQKQKQEAAFGTSKKTGFTPRSSVADEPPVTNKNYYTNRFHPTSFTEPEPMSETPSQGAGASAAADPFAEMRDQFMDNLDTRQRTPYHTPGGEKTHLFGSSQGLGRSTSTRTPPRPFEMPGSFPRPRHRSASPSRSSSNDGGSEDSAKTKMNGASSRNHTSTQPTASGSRPTATSYTEPSSSSTTAPGQPNGNGPSVYAPQTFPTRYQAQFTTATTIPRPSWSCERNDQESDWSSSFMNYQLPTPSSEGNLPHDFNTLLPIERNQRETIDRLVKKYSMNHKSLSGNRDVMDGRQHRTSSNPSTNHNKVKLNANSAASSFAFGDGPGLSKTSTGYNGFARFARNSTENINTRFAGDEMDDEWQFNAGSASANEATTPSKPRPQSRNRPIRRQTPLSKSTIPTEVPQAQEAPDGATADANGFSAGVWNEQIGTQHFEPQSTNSTSTSPTRRTTSRRSKTFRMTAGTAAVVDEESETPPDEPGPSFSVPDAMDIDTPPTEKTKGAANPPPADSARTYFTEPHRPDWRAGDVNSVTSKTSGPTSTVDGAKDGPSKMNGHQPEVSVADQPSSKHVGSEDTEDFLATFKEFKKVEPFMEPSPKGLGSFEDLKSTLPFESQPSEQLPLDIKPPGGPLEFPLPPVAPRLPPTMGVAGIRPNNSSFRKYTQDFNNYMEKWQVFNKKVITHFSTRQEEFNSRRSRRGANWLEEGVRDYLIEVDQDLDVQKKHLDACAEHRKRVAEYMDFKDRVR